jgi:hypothetical protein
MIGEITDESAAHGDRDSTLAPWSVAVPAAAAR